MQLEYIYSKPNNYNRAAFLSATGLDEEEVIDNEQREVSLGVIADSLVIKKEGFTMSPSEINAIFGG